MTLPLEADPLPLTTDAHGVIRVAGTRITLDTILSIYKTGATPEEIAETEGIGPKLAEDVHRFLQRH